MALKQANMIKRITASGGGDLEAKAGESLRVKWIGVLPSTNDTYLKVTVDRVTVAYYRVKGKSGNHLGVLHGAYIPFNLMRFLAMKGVNVTIPVAEGQTLSVSRYAEAGNVMIVYDRYDAGDCKATDPNGTECREYTFIQYAKVGTVPTASGDALIDTSLTPAEFPNFPCGAVVPSKFTMTLLGIVGSAFVNAAAGPVSFASNFLKLIKDREVLFDQDRNGIPFDGTNATATADAYVAAFSLIGPGTEVLVNTNIVTPGDPLIFDTPIVFDEGAELLAYLTVTKSGTTTYTAGVDDQAFIIKATRK